MNFLNRKTVEDIDVTGKRVLVRCDYNVPFDSEGNITDTKRIDESIKTLRYLIDHNAKVIICSHRGRPKGTVKPELSLGSHYPLPFQKYWTASTNGYRRGWGKCKSSLFQFTRRPSNDAGKCPL